MKFAWIDKKLGVLLLGFTLLLSACMIPGQDDPFERLEGEPTQMVRGVIYPFSIASVSTRVTHRLEHEGQLVSYLASDIARLEDFEGREVQLEGVIRNEKMREIFWVESIEVLDLPTEVLLDEEDTHKRFGQSRFTFAYPANWNFSEAPDGRVYFNDKNDLNGTVFFTFQAKKKQDDITPDDVNIFVQSLTGKRTIEANEIGKERDEVRLLSNLYDTEYRFVFSRNIDDIEKKRLFQSLLNSFVEGEIAVAKVLEEEQKEKAEREAQRVLSYNETLEEELSNDEDPEEGGEDAEIQEIDVAIPVDTPAPVVEPTVQTPDDMNGVIESGDPFENQIDSRAHYYESTRLGFRMRVPYLYYFRSFGTTTGEIIELGFSLSGDPSAEISEFLMAIVPTAQPLESTEETILGRSLIVEVPRDENTIFRFTGQVEDRDSILSVASSIEQF